MTHGQVGTQNGMAWAGTLPVSVLKLQVKTIRQGYLLLPEAAYAVSAKLTANQRSDYFTGFEVGIMAAWAIRKCWWQR